jgi:CheY-specific phosphatase CheX
MRARLDEQSVIKANAQFWEQMLAMKLETLPGAEQPRLGAAHLSGSVTLSGAWTGTIEVRLGCGLAFQATAAMMMQALESVLETDALDATREIANMIAGTIKSSLPRPCSMSVPNSAVERESFSVPPPAEDTLLVSFRHPSGDLTVRVFEQECAV